MRLTELKKIIEIDDQISNLHKELNSLYAERSRYVHMAPVTAPHDQTISGPTYSGTTAVVSKKTWVEQEYSKLAASWGMYGIALPSASKVKKGLGKAFRIINELEALDPGLTGQLGVLLVPSSNDIGYPGASDLRKQQAFIRFEDHLNIGLPRKPRYKDWQLFVACITPEALDWGSAKEILTAKRYHLGNYDLRGLGLFEYFALTLQRGEPVDNGTWTTLLKNCNEKTTEVPSATFYNGQYRYELDDIEGLLSLERFRPGVKVAL